ncbi:DUF4245 domain-containing protein [Pseudonocardia sp. ICBG1142]|uniref:DUF4245 domain-containing protein n=1 Tax=Pseudonocardia sp. ICBG1142 TaxID=2846760 RepID=UPI001CF65872|nr:DUF4245 domain-containing protein [Pseudonocardia sp. ICBG1142]
MSARPDPGTPSSERPEASEPGGSPAAPNPAAPDPAAPDPAAPVSPAADPAAAADSDPAPAAARAPAAAPAGAARAGRPQPPPVTRRIPEAGPQAMHKPGRGDASVRDLIWACLILVPVALLIFSVGGSCSFSPGGPAEDAASAPSVDAPARIAEYARGSTFPLRLPDVPFRANSTDRGPVEGGGTAVRIGFVTPDADFLSLVQTDGSVEGVLATESGSAGRGDGPPTMRGTVQAGGLTWEVYGAEGGEPFRVATLPGRPEVRVLVTGSASEDQFRTLADALTTARVFPPGS